MFKLRYTLFFSLLTANCSLICAQQHADHIIPLRTNPVLVNKTREGQRANKSHKITPPPPITIKTLKLPFLDDFAKPGPYPDPNLWQNYNVFVNYTYPVCPHTLGVATFDGVNAYGLPYDPKCPLYASEPADTLTSQLIGMGAYHPKDTVYLSFYWQAGGFGTVPKPNDTLILEFFNGSTWKEIWYHLGYTPTAPDTGFHLVMIPVKDSEYFINGFQFRFRSYANTSGNLDHWNLDQVYMNRLVRSYLDTFQYNVAFVYESQSLLQNYEFMPWEQFTAGDLKTKISVFARDNDTGYVLNANLVNTSYYYDAIPGFLAAYSSGAYNASAFNAVGYTGFNPPYPPFTNPTLTFTFNPLTGPTTYTFVQHMTTNPNFDPWVDTLRFNQVFSNYYAYDDGTAEASYLINGSGNPVSLACQFTLNKPDTLLGMYLFFNYVITNAQGYSFRLALWNDGGGQPGKLIYEDPSIYNPYYDSLDAFVYYKFDSLLALPAGTIYVGFVQTFGDSINIGWDWNDNHQNQIFYNVANTGWNYSSYAGSVMLRPVFGNPIFNSVKDVIANNETFKLYPNPARDVVNLSNSMDPGTLLRIYGVDGKLCFENENFSGNLINTSTLPVGFYIVEITSKAGATQFSKLLISR